MQSTLTIHRSWRLPYAAHALRVLLDEVEILRIRPGETKTVPTDAGPYQISVKLGWTRGRPLAITVRPGENLEFVCAVAPRGALDVLKMCLGSVKSSLRIAPVAAGLSILPKIEI